MKHHKVIHCFIHLVSTLFMECANPKKQRQCSDLNLYCEQKQQSMEKISQGQQTKGTEMSFPIILSTLKQRESQSEKTLFKNDSLSSDEAAPVSSRPKKVMNAGNFPELDQIKRFLKKGDQINNETLKKLKEDKQINEIVQQDRSSASLYKTSRHLDIMSLDNQKEKQIKRIYMSHKKTKAKPLFIFPIYRGKKLSQQVQTDVMQPASMIDSRKNMTLEVNSSQKYPKFHHISNNTIQQQSWNKLRKRYELNAQIQQDMEEQKLLPAKQRTNLSARAKALQGKHNVEGYMKSIGKTSLDFYSGVGRNDKKYKEYRQQETIFSKSIDTKPLFPINQELNSFGELNIKPAVQEIKFKKQEELPVKSIVQLPEILVQDPRKEKTVNNSMKQSALLKIQKVQSKLQEMEKKIQSFKQSMVSQPLLSITLDKNQKQFQRHSSMIPQESENISPYPSTRSRRVTSMVTQNLINLVPSSPAEKKRLKNQNKEKTSILIQVPSMHQLKVGEAKPTTEPHIYHPIRQSFNQNDLAWVKNQYHPKNQLFKGVDLINFQIKKYKNGVYFGEINEEGQKHGKGIIFYYSGKIYEGQMHKDLKQGKGLEIYPDGSRFKGQFVAGLKQGRGIFEWSNGQIYDGQWEGGRKNGSGMWKGIDGESYIGQWKNEKVEGFGVYIMKNGSRYEGEFKNSLKHGVGTERFYNGQTYVGNYEKNRPNGQGQYYWANGDYYKGTFSNGLRHGFGYFKEGKSSIEYRGQYKNDKKCGYGQISYENGVVYIGNFQNNYRHGFGQLKQNQEIKYRGYWINDQRVDQQVEQNISNPKRTQLTQHTQPNSRKKEVKSTPFNTIKQEELERQESLPRPLNNPKNHAQTGRHLNHHHHHSPSQDPEGYKRPCGCNRKH